MERDGGDPSGSSCPYSQSQAHITHSQASDPSTAPGMKTLLFKLAHRLVTSSPTPSYLTADRFHMHISILKELELYDEANTLLESDIGKTICSTSLACDQTRREIWRGRGLFGEEGQRAQQKILNGSVSFHTCVILELIISLGTVTGWNFCLFSTLVLPQSRLSGKGKSRKRAKMNV